MKHRQVATAKAKGRKLRQAPRLSSDDPVILELWARAGGRCELYGCNDFLLQDELTTNRAKLADIAHIVARSKDGPRGDDPMLLSQRNKIENLFLACTKHHRLIDNKAMVARYPKEILIQYKQTHEERIRFVTGLGDENETVIVRMIGNIRGSTVSISNEEIRQGVLKSSNRYPRYLGGENHIEIDLRTITENDLHQYWNRGIETIKDVIDRRITPAIQKGEIQHLSLFAFARIPFLIYLGYAIGDKLTFETFQKHRTGGESWVWPANQTAQRFVFRREVNGSDKSRIAVMISLSGNVQIAQISSSISAAYTVYSLAPDGSKPSRSILSCKDSVDQFRLTYANLLREIEAAYPLAKEIHLFPAVPISAAIILGRDLLRNVSPSLIIYDKGRHGFEKAIRINANKED